MYQVVKLGFAVRSSRFGKHEATALCFVCVFSHVSCSLVSGNFCSRYADRAKHSGFTKQYVYQQNYYCSRSQVNTLASYCLYILSKSFPCSWTSYAGNSFSITWSLIEQVAHHPTWSRTLVHVGWSYTHEYEHA